MSGEAAHGSLKTYGIGFALSVVLTVIPFWVVMGDVIDSTGLAVGVVFLTGGIQMLVHIHYFLHVSLKAESGWQMMSILFTILLLIIILSGSVWIMFHLDENMMPAHDQIERLRNLP